MPHVTLKNAFVHTHTHSVSMYESLDILYTHAADEPNYADTFFLSNVYSCSAEKKCKQLGSLESCCRVETSGGKRPADRPTYSPTGSAKAGRQGSRNSGCATLFHVATLDLQVMYILSYTSQFSEAYDLFYIKMKIRTFCNKIKKFTNISCL